MQVNQAFEVDQVAMIFQLALSWKVLITNRSCQSNMKH